MCWKFDFTYYKKVFSAVYLWVLALYLCIAAIAQQAQIQTYSYSYGNDHKKATKMREEKTTAMCIAATAMCTAAADFNWLQWLLWYDDQYYCCDFFPSVFSLASQRYQSPQQQITQLWQQHVAITSVDSSGGSHLQDGTSMPKMHWRKAWRFGLGCRCAEAASTL